MSNGGMIAPSLCSGLNWSHHDLHDIMMVAYSLELASISTRSHQLYKSMICPDSRVKRIRIDVDIST